MLEPNKVALAVLYYLYSDTDPSGEPSEMASAIGNGMTPGMVSAGLNKLVDLGLVIGTGPMPVIVGDRTIPGHEWWSITNRGHDLAFRLVQQPKSFFGRLHSEGFSWLSSPTASKAKLSVDLTAHGVEQVFAAQGPKEVNWSKSGAIATWTGIPIAIVSIVVALWLADKF